MELLLQFFPFSSVPKGDTLWHVFSGGGWLFKQQPHLLLYLSSFSKVGRHHPEEQESPEQHIIIQHLLLFCSRKVRKTMFLPSPFSDWSRSSFFWVMPQHRSGAAIWATNYSFKFSMHSCAHQRRPRCRSACRGWCLFSHRSPRVDLGLHGVVSKTGSK